MTAQVYRSDAVQVRQDGVDPLTGFWRGEATIARVGVYQYSDASGKTWMEYVPPETLADENWLDSMSLAPVTLEHPPELVNADNVKRYSVGTTGSEVEFDDGANEADLVVQDAAAVGAVQKGMREVSCGYLCAVEWTAGEWLDAFGIAHPYDAVQRQRIGNHLALTQRGRQGETVSLRGDSAALRGDGAAWMVPMADNTAEMQAKLDAAQVVTSELQAKCDGYMAELDSIKGKMDAAMAEIEAMKSKMADAKMDSFAEGKSFAALEAQAKTVCGDAYKADGKDVLQVKRDMLDALKVKIPESHKDSADYIAARLDAALEAMSGLSTSDVAGGGLSQGKRVDSMLAETKAEASRRGVIVEG
tara:strand:- start:7804 stop:8883 length:1080 start_codon:yes stop_codon:yes gene_type:complete